MTDRNGSDRPCKQEYTEFDRVLENRAGEFADRIRRVRGAKLWARRLGRAAPSAEDLTAALGDEAGIAAHKRRGDRT